MSVTELTLAPQEHSPAAARETVRTAVHDAGLHHLLDEALLLTTELVTNALVQVPGAEQDRFASEYYPRLSRVATVISVAIASRSWRSSESSGTSMARAPDAAARCG